MRSLRSRRLKTGVTISQARAEINQPQSAIGNSLPGRAQEFWSAGPEVTRPIRRKNYEAHWLVLFGGPWGSSCSFACANIMNLLLVSKMPLVRRKPAVRTALGANQWRLIRQLLTESLLLSFFGRRAGPAFFAAGGIENLELLCSRRISPSCARTGTETAGCWDSLLAVLSSWRALGCGLLPAVRTLNANLVGTPEARKQGRQLRSGITRCTTFLVISEVAMGPGFLLDRSGGCCSAASSTCCMLIRAFQNGAQS